MNKYIHYKFQIENVAIVPKDRLLSSTTTNSDIADESKWNSF